MRKSYDVLHAVSQTKLLTELTIDLSVDAFGDNALNGKVFEDVLR